MLRDLTNKLIHNLGLKILALFFAVIMWMAVVNLDDPTISKPFTVAVSIENESAVTASGKYFELAEDSGNVSFSVSGKRSIIDKLSASDFKATADMSRMIQTEDKNVVPVEITALRNSSQLTISKRGQEIEVKLEDLMKNQFIIQPSPHGDPAEGYTLGNMEVTPNLLRVSGPKNVVSQINTVKAVIDVSGINSDITDSVVPVLLDAEGNAIDTTKLTLNLNTVTMKVNILSQKTVPIKVNYVGQPADGYEVISAKADPAEIMIKGRPETLNLVGSITIPGNVVNVSGVDALFEQQVDISKYLPDGVTLSDSSKSTIKVIVDVEQLDRKTITIPVANIQVDNLPEGYRIQFNSRTVSIVVYGLRSDLDRLNTSMLRPVLDVQGLTAGSHVGTLTFSLDGEYIIGDTSVSFVIQTIQPSTGEDETQTDTDDTQTNTDDTESDDDNVSGSTVDDTGDLEE